MAESQRAGKDLVSAISEAVLARRRSANAAAVQTPIRPPSRSCECAAPKVGRLAPRKRRTESSCRTAALERSERPRKVRRERSFREVSGAMRDKRAFGVLARRVDMAGRKVCGRGSEVGGMKLGMPREARRGKGRCNSGMVERTLPANVMERTAEERHAYRVT